MNIVEAMDDEALFAPWFRGSSWDGWRAILKAAFCLPMTADEIAFFKTVAGDREPPKQRVRELWCCVGRRGGKDSIASLIMAHAASSFEDEDRLRPGERALAAGIACDRTQAKIVTRYAEGYFERIESLISMEARSTNEGLELPNSVDLTIATNSFRAVRGRPILVAVLDECAFFRDDSGASANPDREVYNAIRPGMATLPNSMLVGISSPYRRAGMLWDRYKKYFGKNDDSVLVIQAPSRALTPTLDQSLIDEALADDPAAARAEWLAEFRTDIESFLAQEVIDAAIELGTHEIPPQVGIQYRGFVDGAGGSGGDSFTLGIAHREGDRVVLDCIRERRPPFSPNDVCEEFATVLKSYGITQAKADRWGAQFTVEGFSRHGVTLEQSAAAKSEIYKEAIPLFNSGRVRLLDNARLIAQLVSLERRTVRGGKDSIDHPANGHDDVANSACGAIVEASGIAGGFDIATYIKAYGSAADIAAYDGKLKVAAEQVVQERQAQLPLHQRNMAVFVTQERHAVLPRDPNGDAPAIMQI